MLSEKKFLRSRSSRTILVVVSILFLIGMASVWAFSQPKSVSSWGMANVAPAGLVRTAIAQNYLAVPREKPLDESQIKVLKVPGIGAGNLYVIDFNTPQLCGSGGCLYAVYTQHARLVLSLLLNPKLPKGTSLFSISEETRNGFSCLVIAQSTVDDAAVEERRYCYEGAGFTLINSSVTKGGA